MLQTVWANTVKTDHLFILMFMSKGILVFDNEFISLFFLLRTHTHI